MSWFKKIFGSQYGFSSQSYSQGSSQSSSQEPKVSYVKEKTETDGDEIENLTISEIKKCDDTTQDDNKSDEEEEQKDDEKISFYLKLGKYKKFKYMKFLFLESKMNHVNTN